MHEPQQVVYTIGHSNRSIDVLLDLLRSVNVQNLVDVRAYPRSRRHPQFESDALRHILADAGMTYQWVGAELGGFRKGKPDSPHRALKPVALRAYADHMDTDEFHTAINALIRRAHELATAIMCAEKHPTNCHRSLISDYLTMRGIRVLHVIDADNVVKHRLSTVARCESDRLVYDRMIQVTLGLHEET